jgi:hypothetical protein
MKIRCQGNSWDLLLYNAVAALFRVKFRKLSWKISIEYSKCLRQWPFNELLLITGWSCVCRFCIKFCVCMYIYGHDLMPVWLVKTRFWIGHWIYSTLILLTILDCNLHYIAISLIHHNTQWVFSAFCPFTSPLVPASNSWRSLSWVPELSPSHSHSDSWLTMLSPSSGTASSCRYLYCLELSH